MTSRYSWNPMPHRVEVRCPRCGARAAFEFAEAVRIKRKADIPLFEAHPMFEVQVFDGTLARGRWTGAVFYPGLHVQSPAALRGLPKGYAAGDWNHSKFLYRSHALDIGAIACDACGLHRKHALQWPSDAWYQLEYRGELLWAFHRESALELHAFIEAKDRRKTRYRWRIFLMNVPKHFLAAGARATVAKKLARLLA